MLDFQAQTDHQPIVIDYTPTLTDTPGRAARPVMRTNPDKLPFETRRVLDIDVIDAQPRKLVHWIQARARTRSSLRLAWVTAHQARRIPESWQDIRAIQHFDALIADGHTMQAAARLGRAKLGANTSFAPLFMPLCRALADDGQRLFIVGGQPGEAPELANRLKRMMPRLRIAGTHPAGFQQAADGRVAARIRRSRANLVILAGRNPEQDQRLSELVQHLDTPVVLRIGALPPLQAVTSAQITEGLASASVSRLETIAAAWEAGRSARGAAVSRFLKRALDVSIASLAVAGLSPLMISTALAIRLESRGPALFRQTRTGENGKPFTMYKFRSMHTDAEARLAALMKKNDRNDGVTFKLRQDPRITRIGHFIRKFSIDELPQLLNVIKGDMSLVGPRPALPREVDLYSVHDKGRLSGKPGITGIWQVSGRADIPFQKMVEMDIDYLKTRTIWTDIILLARTPLAVLAAKGAY